MMQTYQLKKEYKKFKHKDMKSANIDNFHYLEISLNVTLLILGI